MVCNGVEDSFAQHWIDQCSHDLQYLKIRLKCSLSAHGVLVVIYIIKLQLSYFWRLHDVAPQKLRFILVDLDDTVSPRLDSLRTKTSLPQLQYIHSILRSSTKIGAPRCPRFAFSPRRSLPPDSTWLHVEILDEYNILDQSRPISYPSAIHLAAIGGHAEVLRLISQNPSDVSCSSESYLTPSEDHQIAVKGASLDLYPIHWSSLYGHAGAVEVLLRKGVDPNIRSKERIYQFTPLHLATATGRGSSD